jgi:hypothetical protein
MFGYNAINDLLGKKGTVEVLQLKKMVEFYIRSYSTEYGSVAEKGLYAPGDIRYLCFTNYYFVGGNRNCDDANPYVFNPAIKDSMGNTPAEREKKNVFMINKKGFYEDGFYAGNISVASKSGTSCNYLCVMSVRGQFHLKFAGKGDHVEVSDNS